MTVDAFMGTRFEKKYTHCPACDGADIPQCYSLNVPDATIDFAQCKQCGLVFQNPKMTIAFLQHTYAATNYFGHEPDKGDSAYTDYTANDWLRIRQSRARLERIIRISGIRNGRLLDVGCATGFFAYAATLAGFSAKGVEPDSGMSEFGRRTYGLDITTATLESANIPPGEADIVSVWGTDSHFQHPVEGFSLLAKALRTGGVLAMNYQAFDHPIRLIFPGIKKSWNALFNLTDRSLNIILKKAGFTILHRGGEWQRVPMSHLLKVLKLPQINAIGRLPLVLPAISYRFVVARKE